MTARERCLLTFKPSLAALVWRPAGRLAIAIGMLVAMQRQGDKLPFDEIHLASALHWVGDAIIVMIAIEACVLLARRQNERLDLYDDRVAHTVGLTSRCVTMAWLAEITGIAVAQSLGGRVLGYGDLVIETRGTETIRFRGLGEPANAERTIEQLRRRATRTAQDR